MSIEKTTQWILVTRYIVYIVQRVYNDDYNIVSRGFALTPQHYTFKKKAMQIHSQKFFSTYNWNGSWLLLAQLPNVVGPTPAFSWLKNWLFCWPNSVSIVDSTENDGSFSIWKFTLYTSIYASIRFCKYLHINCEFQLSQLPFQLYVLKNFYECIKSHHYKPHAI